METDGDACDWGAPFLAMDTSYAVFHRFFAMRRWERAAGLRCSEPDSSPTSDADLTAFGESFRRSLCDQMRGAGVPPRNTFLLVDCPRSDIWRRDLHLAYKATRPARADLAPNLFTYVRGQLLPDLVEGLGVRALSVARAEADDLAAVFARWTRAHGGPPLTILTGDADLAQLAEEGVAVKDLKGACVLSKACRKLGCEPDAALYLRAKVLQGDKGDNVPPAGARVGPKTALRLATDDAALEHFLADPAHREQRSLNRRLVDLSALPAAIEQRALEELRAYEPA